MIDTAKIPLRNECVPPPIPVSDLLHKYSFFSNKDSEEIVQLGSTSPSNEYFPSKELSRCLTRAARVSPDVLNTYGFANNKLRSYYHPENATAQYIFHVHGVSISPDENCHTGGANEAIRNALRVLTKPGDVVAVESPGFLGTYQTLQHMHLQALEIPVNFPDGLDLGVFEKKLKDGARPKCIIVTPNFQNPTGALMPLKARDRLIALCMKHEIAIIEDDVLGALRFGERISSLKERMPDEVIYVGSYSKIFAPGYRVGWAAGGKYAYNLQVLNMIESAEATPIGHLALTEYIKSGKYAQHIKNLRNIYQENCEKMTIYIRQFFPASTEVSAPVGGQYLWVTLPDGMSAEKLFYDALDKHILLAPGNLFSIHHKYDQNMRICFAMPITQKIIDSIEIVGNLSKS